MAVTFGHGVAAIFFCRDLTQNESFSIMAVSQGVLSMCTHGCNENETCEICDAEHGLPPLSKLVPPYNKIFPIETEALAQGRKLMQQYVQDRMRMQGVVSGYFSQINELIVTGHNISVNKVVETASKDVVIVFRLSRSPITDLCEGKA